MIIGRVTKSSGLRRWVRVNHPWLDTDETILTFTVTVTTESEDATDAGDPDFEVVETDIDGSYGYFLMDGGLDGGVYHARCVAVTSSGQHSDDVIVFEIDNGGV